MEVMTPKDYGRCDAHSLRAPLHTTLAVLPQMRSRQPGRIVNISSIGGKIAVAALAALQRQQVRARRILRRPAIGIAQGWNTSPPSAPA